LATVYSSIVTYRNIRSDHCQNFPEISLGREEPYKWISI